MLPLPHRHRASAASCSEHRPPRPSCSLLVWSLKWFWSFRYFFVVMLPFFSFSALPFRDQEGYYGIRGLLLESGVLLCYRFDFVYCRAFLFIFGAVFTLGTVSSLGVASIFRAVLFISCAGCFFLDLMTRCLVEIDDPALLFKLRNPTTTTCAEHAHSGQGRILEVLESLLGLWVQYPPLHPLHQNTKRQNKGRTKVEQRCEKGIPEKTDKKDQKRVPISLEDSVLRFSFSPGALEYYLQNSPMDVLIGLGLRSFLNL